MKKQDVMRVSYASCCAVIVCVDRFWFMLSCCMLVGAHAVMSFAIETKYPSDAGSSVRSFVSTVRSQTQDDRDMKGKLRGMFLRLT